MILKMPTFAELGLSWGNLSEGPFISFYGLSFDSNVCRTRSSFQQARVLHERTTLSDLPQRAPVKTHFRSHSRLSRFFTFCQNSLGFVPLKEKVFIFDFTEPKKNFTEPFSRKSHFSSPLFIAASPLSVAKAFREPKPQAKCIADTSHSKQHAQPPPAVRPTKQQLSQALVQPSFKNPTITISKSQVNIPCVHPLMIRAELHGLCFCVEGAIY